jgi:hypothetical protein
MASGAVSYPKIPTRVCRLAPAQGHWSLWHHARDVVWMIIRDLGPCRLGTTGLRSLLWRVRGYGYAGHTTAEDGDLLTVLRQVGADKEQATRWTRRHRRASR